jgi:NAD(P)-dependent dehydrogenase (short-subunit alcohol dehydrogenase family)
LSLKEKICLVTGATSGIGLETARELARQGATTVIVSRNPERCAAAALSIRQETGNPGVDFIAADLSSQAQIRELANTFLGRYTQLHVLVNNAGGFFLRRQKNIDGFEMTWALNHLSYFLLTNLLLETIQASAPARIVNVSSGAHLGGHINFDDLQGKRWSFGWTAYSQSKLANVLFTKELARRLEGSKVTANAVHPGFVATNFAKNNGMLVRLFMPLAQIGALSPEEGAITSIYLASSPDVEGVSGKYFYKEQPAPSSPESDDLDVARRLWEISAEMTRLPGGRSSQAG